MNFFDRAHQKTAAFRMAVLWLIPFWVLGLVACGQGSDKQARSLIMNREYDRAIAYLQQEIEQKPGSVELRMPMAEVLLLTGKIYQGEAHLQEVRRIDRENGTNYQRLIGPMVMYLTRLELYWAFGDLAESLLSSPDDRNDPRIKQESGGNRDPSRAIELMKMALRYSYDAGQEASAICLELANSLIEQNAYKPALQLIEYASRDPLVRSDITHMLLGVLEANIGAQLLSSSGVLVQLGKLAVRVKPESAPRVAELFFAAATSHLKSGRASLAQALSAGFEPAVAFDPALEKNMLQQLRAASLRTKNLTDSIEATYVLGKYGTSAKNSSDLLVALALQTSIRKQPKLVLKMLGYALELNPGLWRKTRVNEGFFDSEAEGDTAIRILMNFYVYHTSAGKDGQKKAVERLKMLATKSKTARRILKKLGAPLQPGEGAAKKQLNPGGARAFPLG